MKTIKFTNDNIEKIKSGNKTATSRTFRLEDGWYKVDNTLEVELKGYYYESIYHMKDHEAWAVSEGYEDWQDFYENCLFSHTKNFMGGYSSLYIYQIINKKIC